MSNAVCVICICSFAYSGHAETDDISASAGSSKTAAGKAVESPDSPTETPATLQELEELLVSLKEDLELAEKLRAEGKGKSAICNSPFVTAWLICRGRTCPFATLPAVCPSETKGTIFIAFGGQGVVYQEDRSAGPTIPTWTHRRRGRGPGRISHRGFYVHTCPRVYFPLARI